MLGVSRFLWGWLTLLLIVSCTARLQKQAAPLYIKDHYAEAALIGRYGEVVDNHYIVKRGDTLYSIGFRFEQHYKVLADWNNIKPPYEIQAGQKIALFAPALRVHRERLAKSKLIEDKTTVNKVLVKGVPTVQVLPVYNMPSEPVEIKDIKPVHQQKQAMQVSAKDAGISSLKPIQPKIKSVKTATTQQIMKPVAVKSTPAKPALALGDAKKEIPAVNKQVVQQPINGVGQKIAKMYVPKQSKDLNWLWPVKGKIIKDFAASNKKGIDIASNVKHDVKASESGIVVYGGDGLVGYGKLLIIKHNDEYLSAYANNNRLLVKEGQMVKQGQVIALVGVEVNKGLPLLHFEIRKKGKPVNPQHYLK